VAGCNIGRNDLSKAISQINEWYGLRILICCAGEPVHGVRLVIENKDWRTVGSRDSLLFRPVRDYSDNRRVLP
jgi:hypothetical protein